MTQYYDTISEFERDGFTVIVDKTYEDFNPRDHFEADDIDEILRKIDNGTYEWFMLRVRVLVEGLELGSHYLGGCLYEDARDVLTDGTAEDCIGEALKEAKSQVYRMKQKFAELSDMVDRESACA
jgi:GH15 family glucan-1,4-alpha-glucosidase